MNAGIIVDMLYSTSITAELSREEKHRRDKEQLKGVMFFLGAYVAVIAALVLL